MGIVERLRNGGQPDLADMASDLARNLERVTFLLSSARLLIHDAHARAIASEAVADANKALAAAKGHDL